MLPFRLLPAACSRSFSSSASPAVVDAARVLPQGGKDLARACAELQQSTGFAFAVQTVPATPGDEPRLLAMRTFQRLREEDPQVGVLAVRVAQSS